MNRFLALTWMVAFLAAQPQAALADAGEEPGQDGPRVVCVGDAPAPSVLRFAFQAEPAWRFRPEILRSNNAGARRRGKPARPAPGAAAGRDALYLPCILG